MMIRGRLDAKFYESTWKDFQYSGNSSGIYSNTLSKGLDTVSVLHESPEIST